MKYSALLSFFLVFFLALFSASHLMADQESPKANLTGKLIGRKDINRKEWITWSTDWASPGGRGIINANGTYLFTDLEPGRYRICYRGENIMPSYYVVEVSSGENTFDINLPPCRLKGQIPGTENIKRNPDDFILGDIQVIPFGTSVMSGNRVAFVFADTNGAFYVDHIPADAYTIRWDKYNEYVARLTIQPGQNEATASLYPPKARGGIRGEIKFGKAGNQNIAVHAFPKTPQGYDITVWNTCYVKEAPYRYLIDNLPVGIYGIFITSSEFDKAIPMQFLPGIEVLPDLNIKADIEISQGRNVQFKFDYAKGKPIMARWDLIYPTGESLPDQAFVGSGPEGFYSSQSPFSLPFGKYKVIAHFGKEKNETHEFNLVEGDGIYILNIQAPESKMIDWAKRK